MTNLVPQGLWGMGIQGFKFARGTGQTDPGGTCRGGPQYQAFKKLSKNPLEIPKVIPS